MEDRSLVLLEFGQKGGLNHYSFRGLKGVQFRFGLIESGV